MNQRAQELHLEGRAPVGPVPLVLDRVVGDDGWHDVRRCDLGLAYGASFALRDRVSTDATRPSGRLSRVRACGCRLFGSCPGRTVFGARAMFELDPGVDASGLALRTSRSTRTTPRAGTRGSTRRAGPGG